MDREREEQHQDDQAPDEGVIGALSGPGRDAEEGVEEPEGERPSPRPRPWVLGCLLALLGALLGAAAALLVGRGCGPATPEGTVIAPPPGSYDTRLVFSAGPEEPAATPDLIPAETSVVFCFYRLKRVPADARLTAKWWRDGEELGALELRDLRPDPAAGHAAGRFTIYPPAAVTAEGGGRPSTSAAPSHPATFPPGIYEVELTTPAQPDVVARSSFVALPRTAKILQGGGDPVGPPVIRALTTAPGIDQQGRAVGPTAVFPPSVSRIYAVFEYSGVPPGAVLTARWFLEGNELEAARAEIPIPAEQGSAHAWLEVGRGDRLPDAHYQVGIYLGDEDRPLASSGFRIGATASPTASGEAHPGG